MIPKSKIEEAAVKYNPVMKLDNEFIRNGYRAGVAFAEKELENLAVEFAKWMRDNVYYKDGFCGKNFIELFEIFKQEKYENTK